MLLRENVHLKLSKIILATNCIPILKACAFCFMNISREQLSLSFTNFEKMTQTLKTMLKIDDIDIKNNCLFALRLLCCDEKKRIQGFLNLNILSEILEYTLNNCLMISEPALKLIGNVSFGDHSQALKLIYADVLDYLKSSLESNHSNIRKETIYILSNFAGDSVDIIQYIIDHPIIDIFLEKAQDGDFSVKKETSYFFYNISMMGTYEQIIKIIQKNAFYALYGLIDTTDPLLLKNYLSFIKRTLVLDEENQSNYCMEEIVASNLIVNIEKLQKHMNCIVYGLVSDILKYFNADEAEIDEDIIMTHLS